MRLEVCSPRQDFGAEKLLEIALQHDMLQIRRKHPEIMRSSMKIMKDQLLINFWLSWNARRWRKTRSILALTTTRRRESHDPRIRKLTQMHCKVSSHSKPISSHFQCFDMFFFLFFRVLHRQIRQLPNGADQGSTVKRHEVFLHHVAPKGIFQGPSAKRRHWGSQILGIQDDPPSQRRNSKKQMFATCFAGLILEHKHT